MSETVLLACWWHRPFTNLPIIWAFEYGNRQNVTEIKEKWWPLIKGDADFWSCFLSPLPNKTQDDGYLHLLSACTNENWHTEECPGNRDTTRPLSMLRRSLGVVDKMAAVVGETPDPKWAATYAKLVPTPTGWFHVADATSRMGNTSHNCSFCAWKPGDKSRTKTSGDCMLPASGTGMMNGAWCAPSVGGRCPAGMGPCAQQFIAPSVSLVDGKEGMPNGGNYQDAFPVFPADAIGTNSSLTPAGAATVASDHSWSQGNAFTKVFSAAARVTGPGLLNATEVFNLFEGTLRSYQQPNFVPFNGVSGFETIGASEYVNYALLQSDPAGFLGLFEAWPPSMDASFARLRARGAFVVTSSFEAHTGGVGITTIVSERGERCILRRPLSWPRASVTVRHDGSPVDVEWVGGDAFLAFDTQPGMSYTLAG